jgi:DedD protein
VQPPATAAAQPPAAAPSAQPAAAEPKPAEQPGQIATGEIEAPDEQPADGAKPANETGVKAEQPAEAKPKPKPKPQVAAKPKPRPPVKRDPVLKVQPLGDVLNAAPPDPSGAAVLPPPDPPAPE